MRASRPLASFIQSDRELTRETSDHRRAPDRRTASDGRPWQNRPSRPNHAGHRPRIHRVPPRPARPPCPACRARRCHRGHHHLRPGRHRPSVHRPVRRTARRRRPVRDEGLPGGRGARPPRPARLRLRRGEPAGDRPGAAHRGGPRADPLRQHRQVRPQHRRGLPAGCARLRHRLPGGRRRDRRTRPRLPGVLPTGDHRRGRAVGPQPQVRLLARGRPAGARRRPERRAGALRPVGARRLPADDRRGLGRGGRLAGGGPGGARPARHHPGPDQPRWRTARPRRPRPARPAVGTAAGQDVRGDPRGHGTAACRQRRPAGLPAGARSPPGRRPRSDPRPRRPALFPASARRHPRGLALPELRQVQRPLRDGPVAVPPGVPHPFRRAVRRRHGGRPDLRQRRRVRPGGRPGTGPARDHLRRPGVGPLLRRVRRRLRHPGFNGFAPLPYTCVGGPAPDGGDA